MTDTVSEIEIETPQAGAETVAPAAAPPEDDEATKALREQLDAARKTADAERNARAAAERAKKEEEERRAQIEEQYKVERQGSVLSSLEAATAERDHAKAAYKAALAGGDYERAAEEQEKLSSAIWKIHSLEARKGNIEQPTRETTEGRVKAPEPTPAKTSEDPVENYLAQFTPRTQSYLRQRLEIVTNGKMNKKAAYLHDEAVEKGLKPDTDEYFEFMDNELGFGAPAPKQKSTEAAPAAAAKRQGGSIAAAPPSRNPITPAGPGKVRVNLTEGQKRAARIAGVSEEDYAKQFVIAEQTGAFINR